jgi:hypothetical protein
MKFSMLVPTSIDVVGNIYRTKLDLQELSETKNFELDVPCYLLTSDLNFESYEQLQRFFRIKKRNSILFSREVLEDGIYIEASLQLDRIYDEFKKKTEFSYLVMVKKIGDNYFLIVKSNCLESLFLDLEKFVFENLVSSVIP